MIGIKWVEYLFWLTMNTYFETRDQQQEGQVAICHVVMNRVQRRHQTVEEVIRKAKQFSWYNGGSVPSIEEPMELIKCAGAVIDCFGERLQGKNLFGSDHYFNPSIVRPGWAAGMTRTCSVGDHEFYRS